MPPAGSGKRGPALRLLPEGRSGGARILSPAGVGALGDDAEGVSGTTCWPDPRAVRADSFEIASAGYDPSLQLVGGDPSGSQSWAGLVVPTGPTAQTPSFDRRYLFLLAWLRLDANRRGKIIGLRTSVRLGATVTSTLGGVPYPIEHELQDPFWKGPGGNYCFYLRRIPTPGQRLVYNIDDGPSLSFQYANGPALLYQSLNPYIPPGAGVPPGVDLMPGGSWYDNRFGPWRNESGPGSVDIGVQGPCDVGLFISLQQMAQIKPVPAPGIVVPADDAFLQANPLAQFARVSGSIIWQEVSAR
jgi:hypothetical protein